MSVLSADRSFFIVETEGVPEADAVVPALPAVLVDPEDVLEDAPPDAVVPEDPEEVEVDAEDVLPTLGVATLVPEEDPTDAAKAFPERRSPSRTVAIPVFPMTMETFFLDVLCI